MDLKTRIENYNNQIAKHPGVKGDEKLVLYLQNMLNSLRERRYGDIVYRDDYFIFPSEILVPTYVFKESMGEEILLKIKEEIEAKEEVVLDFKKVSGWDKLDPFLTGLSRELDRKPGSIKMKEGDWNDCEYQIKNPLKSEIVCLEGLYFIRTCDEYKILRTNTTGRILEDLLDREKIDLNKAKEVYGVEPKTFKQKIYGLRRDLKYHSREFVVVEENNSYWTEERDNSKKRFGDVVLYDGDLCFPVFLNKPSVKSSTGKIALALLELCENEPDKVINEVQMITEFGIVATSVSPMKSNLTKLFESTTCYNLKIDKSNNGLCYSLEKNDYS